MKKISEALGVDIGGRVRRLRGDRPQGAFARLLGIKSQATLSWIESGKQPPSAALLSEILRATGCEAQWLLSGEGEPFGRAGRVAAGIPWQPAGVVDYDVEQVRASATLRKSLIPVEGSFASGMGVMLSEASREQGMAPYVTAGPAPEGSTAIRIVGPALWLPMGAHAIFGPDSPRCACGFGLVRIGRGAPEMLAAWRRARERYTVYHSGAAQVHRAGDVKLARPLLGLT